jgi:hypothetical protein
MEIVAETGHSGNGTVKVLVKLVFQFIEIHGARGICLRPQSRQGGTHAGAARPVRASRAERDRLPKATRRVSAEALINVVEDGPQSGRRGQRVGVKLVGSG